MEPTRLILLFSTIAFFGGLIYAIFALRSNRWKENRWHILPMGVGFLFQCIFLYQRGNIHGRCPLTNLFEVFIFIGWCIVLLYFLVGATYRLSLLGVFTAPLVALLQTLALISPLDTAARPFFPSKMNYWLELHASIALIAYAAFALACITGVMFLIQNSLLKSHKIHFLFYQLPPIHHLSKAIFRMVGLGVLLLSVAMVTTFKIDIPIPASKLWASWGVLALYTVIFVLMWKRTFTANQTAWLAVLGFLVPFISLWLVTGRAA